MSSNTTHHPFGQAIAKGEQWNFYSEMLLGLSVTTAVIAGFILAITILLSGTLSGSAHGGYFEIPFIQKRIELSAEEATIASHVIFWVGLAATAYCVFAMFRFNWRLAQTAITVYENGIAGLGCGKSSYLLDFQLSWDKIKSIDAIGTAMDGKVQSITGKVITIHAADVVYKCYIKNPGVVQNAIISQQQKAIKPAT
jgi:hypothetical protein